MRRAGVRIRALGDRGETGVALAAVVVALFVLGGLAAAIFLFSFSERQIGRNFVRYQQAAAAADAGAYAPLKHWDVLRYNRLAVGASSQFSGRTLDGTGSYLGAVTRLGARLFLVAAEGRSANDNIRQRAGALMRLRPLDLPIDAALEIAGPFSMDETAKIDGSDQPPFGWSCPPPADPVAAVEEVMPGLDALALGGVTLSDLRAVAVHVLSGGTVWVQPDETNGICVTVNPSNWGNPYDAGRPCGDHFPAVYSLEDLVVSGGHGQGILVVDGDLTVWGDFHYFGVVIVLGKFNSLGTGGQITGAVLVANRDFEPQILAGTTGIRYSKCAVDKSLAASGRGVLLRERSWLDMY